MANSKIQKVTLFPFYTVQYNHELRDKQQKHGELTEENEDMSMSKNPSNNKDNAANISFSFSLWPSWQNKSGI